MTLRVRLAAWLLKTAKPICGCRYDHIVYYQFGCKEHDPEEPGSALAGAQRIEAAKPRPKEDA